MIPQFIYLALIFLGLGLALARHGQPQTGKHNFWHSAIGVTIVLYTLYSGGFFNVFFK